MGPVLKPVPPQLGRGGGIITEPLAPPEFDHICTGFEVSFETNDGRVMVASGHRARRFIPDHVVQLVGTPEQIQSQLDGRSPSRRRADQ